MFVSFDVRYANLKPLQINSQRQFSFKFDAIFFAFLFESIKLIQDADGVLSRLALHTYSCILNEISSTNPSPPASLSSNSLSNLNDNLVRAVQPQIIDHLFKALTNPSLSWTSAQDYMLIGDQFIWIEKNDHNKGIFFLTKNSISYYPDLCATFISRLLL